MRLISLFFVWILTAAAQGPAGPAATLAAQTEQPTALEIVQKSVSLARLNFDRGKDYTFIQRVQQKQLNKEGRAKKTESETFDVLILEGTQYQKKIAENDKPLTDKDLEKATREFEKELARRRDESESARKKRLAKEQEEREELRALLQEIPKAFNLKLLGVGSLEGESVWEIEAKPKQGYVSKVKRADLLPKFEGRIWIDQKEYQWVKVEAKTIAPVSFGWVMAKLYPGSTMTFRQGRVNNEIWLPAEATLRLEARLAMLMKLNGEVNVSWSNYRKFQSDSRIVSAEEVEQK